MFSVYIHVPFCARRCYYCDFITYAGQLNLLPIYTDAAQKEIRLLGQVASGAVLPTETVYFGGGTPSLMEPTMVETLLGEIEGAFGLTKHAEISLEANPGTLSPQRLRDFHTAGVTRLSLGVQSFSDAELALLGRIHTRQEAEKCIAWARAAGFDNLNLDLIFGLPGQTLEAWRQTLQRAVQFRPEHLSVYSLIVEEGTLLHQQISNRKLPEPDDDLAGDMYDLARDLLSGAGYKQYEISNWAVADEFESRHNKAYWKTTPYLGIGAAAHSYANTYRTENVPGILDYCERIQEWGQSREFPFSAANQQRSLLDQRTRMQEFMLLGLRLTYEGVSLSEFSGRFAQDALQVFAVEIKRLEQKGLVEFSEFPDGRHLRLTQRGVILGNQAFMEFV